MVSDSPNRPSPRNLIVKDRDLNYLCNAVPRSHTALLPFVKVVVKKLIDSKSLTQLNRGPGKAVQFKVQIGGKIMSRPVEVTLNVSHLSQLGQY